MGDTSQQILQKAADAVITNFEGSLLSFRGETTLLLPSRHWVPAARMLRDQYNFEILLDITAVDYFPQQEPRFFLNAQLRSMQHRLNLRLRTGISLLEPVIPTLEGVYPNANWYEREVWDLFGIRFEGHSDPRRIMMPEDWQGHPLRKDYPLGYEEVQFTFNVKEIDLRKPYAKE